MSTYSEISENAKGFVLKQDWNSAFLLYTKAITFPSISSFQKSTAYSNRSLVLAKMTRFEQAEKDAIQSIKLNPQNYKAYLRAGNACLALNEIDDGLTYFKLGFGKEGDDNQLENKYSEVYYKLKCPVSIIDKSNKFYDEFQAFKNCFFSQRDMAYMIYQNIINKKLLKEKEKIDVENLVHEMNFILFDNFNFKAKAESDIKDQNIISANLCLKAMMNKEKKEENKQKIFNQMMQNNLLELHLFHKDSIQVLSDVISSPTPKYLINLRILADIFYEQMYFYYYLPSMTKMMNYLDEIKNEGKEWVVKLGCHKRTPSDFYPKDEVKSVGYYWKFFTMNSCSFINSCFAKVIEDLLSLNIVPYIDYYNKETDQTDRIEIIYASMIECIYMKTFTNPMVHYKDFNGHFYLLKGTRLDFRFLNCDYGHSIIALLTKKIVNKKNLFYLVDLTGSQYDIPNLSAKGFPYYEKEAFTSEFQNNEFFYGNVVERLEKFMTGRFTPSPTQYYPEGSWIGCETSTIQEVKKILKFHL